MKETRPRKKDWVLTQEAFDELLLRLHSDPRLAGLKYEEIRRRLELFFRSRGCHGCADLADQTIDRAAKRISEGTEIETTDPASYFLGIAKNVVREYYREQSSRPPYPAPAPPDPSHEIECRERCFRTLDDKASDLLREYYEGGYTAGIERHAEMAQRLGITVNALRIRVHRHRERLEACLKRCIEEKGGEN